MSVIKVNSIQHSGAANASIELNANGRVAFSNTVAFTSNNVTIGGQALSPVTGMRNRIINGDMRIDQRNNGAEVNPAVNGTYYLDRWIAISTQTSKYKIGQNAGSITPPGGFTQYLGLTSLSDYSVVGSEAFGVRQYIEGLNCYDLGWGSANAKTVTLSFWVRSSLTGTFAVGIANSGASRSYPASYTISSANTWEYKTITIPGDTSGTWLTNNGIGIIITFQIGYGSSISGVANSWNAGTAYGVTGATSVVGTNGATFYITGVQLEEGSVATPFERRLYGTELALCQRYYVKNVGIIEGGGVSFATVSRDVIVGIQTNFPVEMRATPTITMLGTTARSGGTTNDERITTLGFTWGRKQTSTGSASVYAYALGGFEANIEL